MQEKEKGIFGVLIILSYNTCFSHPIVTHVFTSLELDKTGALSKEAN